MIRKIKFGKIAIVIFLTILIWVWTDLYLDEEEPVPRATISVAPSPELLVSFSGQPEAVINNIMLKGPARKIAEVRRRLADGSLELDFTLNPELERMTATNSYPLNVMNFLRDSVKKIKDFEGLTVESCEPEIIDVNVVKLVKKSLEIECFDENGVPINVVSKNPEKVDMYVPEGSRLKAQVRLTGNNINQAQLSEAIVNPYVELIPGKRRYATTSVRIKMSPEASPLVRHQILDASLGYLLSKNLLGKYDVDIENYNDLVSFFILATPEAKNAYESQNFRITLEILDEDAKKPPETLHRRDMIYNFPQEYLIKNEIRLEGEPEEAHFKLKPLKPAEAPASGPS
jgi:hypothetical protein